MRTEKLILLVEIVIRLIESGARLLPAELQLVEPLAYALLLIAVVIYIR